MKKCTFLILILLALNTFLVAQTTHEKETFIPSTSAQIKIGTTINFTNKKLYDEYINQDAGSKYNANKNTVYTNPYLSIGGVSHSKKHIGLLFNLGFYQTVFKYSRTYSAWVFPSNASPYQATNELDVKQLHNNIFIELCPSYVIKKHTHLWAGCNATFTSPTATGNLRVTNYNTGEQYNSNLKDKPSDSYHLYSHIGITQGFPIEEYEVTVTVSYFGLLQKFDSGINATLGFLF